MTLNRPDPELSSPDGLKSGWKKSLRDMSAEFECWRSSLEIVGKHARPQLERKHRTLQDQLETVHRSLARLAESRGRHWWDAAVDVDAAFRHFADNLDAAWQELDDRPVAAHD